MTANGYVVSVAKSVEANTVQGLQAQQRVLALAQSRGVGIVQMNGQRIYGPPRCWDGPPPPRGCEVFVGRLPRDAYEDELVPFFERVGTIYVLRLMMDFSGTNRGFAFVQYTTPEAAALAVRQLDGCHLRPGHEIGVVPSVDNCRLFIGGIAQDKSKAEVHEQLARIVEGVERVIMYPDEDGKALNRGYAFVEFRTHRYAAMARRRLVQLWGHSMAIDWAELEPQCDEEVMKQVKILYVRGLSAATTEYDIRAMFESVAEEGCISRVKKVKNFAFVHFKDRENAEKALKHWNEKKVHGSDLEVTWAKPADKLQKIPTVRRKHTESAKQMSRDWSNLSNLVTSSCKDSVGCRPQSMLLPSCAPSYEPVNSVSANYPLSHVSYHNVSCSPLPLKKDASHPLYSQFFSYSQRDVVGNGAPLSVIAAQPSDVTTFTPGAIISHTPLPSPSNYYYAWFSQSEQRQDKQYHNTLLGYELNNNIYMPSYQYF
ncbi:probable RNA-binding protein 46 [Schistocerca piceifrons]|uniref:probable RNA-binding protein 46 n=1 Tax=Schistocerca piceifrons TaxID=274613 RepID=UPI001F5F967C|nr:probable RNA-binding protein 46 [Schistocerca piceifrons]